MLSRSLALTFVSSALVFGGLVAAANARASYARTAPGLGCQNSGTLPQYSGTYAVAGFNTAGQFYNPSGVNGHVAQLRCNIMNDNGTFDMSDGSQATMTVSGYCNAAANHVHFAVCAIYHLTGGGACTTYVTSPCSADSVFDYTFAPQPQLSSAGNGDYFFLDVLLYPEDSSGGANVFFGYRVTNTVGY
jgi:hypothetical protein